MAPSLRKVFLISNLFGTGASPRPAPTFLIYEVLRPELNHTYYPLFEAV
jgi:hypothetical protein